MRGHKDQLTDVERRFAEAWVPGKPGFLLQRKHHDYLRECMRSVAHHEAGHFIARKFSGLEASHILGISIIPCMENLGRVTYESPFAERTLPEVPPSLKRSNGFMLLLEKLAGYRAEMIADKSEEQTVFEHCEQQGVFMEEEGGDIQRAVRIAEIMARPFMPPSRILTLADRWTEDMLSIPAVWGAVETLASLLIARGELGGEEAYSLVHGLGVPWVYSIPKWRRRLFFKQGGPSGSPGAAR